MRNDLVKTLALAALAFVALAIPNRALAANPGDEAPAFTLPDLDGKDVELASFKGSYVILEWVNHDCPFVKKHYESGNMAALQNKYTAAGMVWLTICSSAPGKQGHFTKEVWEARMKAVSAAPKALLLDEKGTVGKAYNAKTTPHMVVIDPTGKIIYIGGIDNQPGVDRSIMAQAINYVVQALEEALAGKPVSVPTAPPYGCSVKY